MEKVAAEGVTKDQAAAAFQQLAYRNREIASAFPLRLMSRVVHLWMHGADPLLALRTGSELETLKRRFAAEPGLFSDLIRQRLLNNPHRLAITMSPDRGIQQKKESEFAARMQKLKSSLTPAELSAIAARQDELDAALSAPNPPEALAALPQLKVRDLPKEPRDIPTTVHKDGNLTLLRNDVFANGVNYLTLTFDLSTLPEELWPYLPLYADCVGKMGAAGMDYAAMAQRVAAHTGGVGFSFAAQTRVESPGLPIRQAIFATKFLDDNVDPALGVLRDLMFELDCANPPRLTDVLDQARSHHRTRPASDGLVIALRHAAQRFSGEARLNELWQGATQTRLLERTGESVQEKLAAITHHLRRRLQPTASFTGTESVFEKVRAKLSEWTARSEKTAGADHPYRTEPAAATPPLGLAAPMNVAYCATVLPAPRIFDPIAPILAVGARLVSFEHVLEEVRFKGTAYGGHCSYGPSMGTWEFTSYRDPWIWRTLDVYRASLDFVRGRQWTQAEIDRAIIGTAKEFERPIRPAEATSAALWRHLMGDTFERRKSRHAAMLAATPATVKKAVLDTLEAGFPKASVCVVSSRQKLEEANAQRPDSPLEIEDILPS